MENLPDTKGHPRRFCVVDSQTQVLYEICAPDTDTLQKWTDGLKLVGSTFKPKLIMSIITLVSLKLLHFNLAIFEREDLATP